MGWTAGPNPLLTIPSLLLVLLFKLVFITTATGANPLLFKFVSIATKATTYHTQAATSAAIH